MAIQQGSVSFCRYRLLGSSSDSNAKAKLSVGIAKLNSYLDPHKSGPLKLSGVHKEELVGWVRPVGVDQVELPPDAPWDLSHAQVDDGFLLRLRIERRKVPAQLLQLIYKQRFYAASEKAGKTLGPKARKELREEVKTDLMARALPAISHVDAYWRDRHGELTLFTTGKKATQIFETLFQATFAAPLGQTLVRIEVPLFGLSREDWLDSHVASETLGRLSLTTPVAFAEQIYP